MAYISFTATPSTKYMEDNITIKITKGTLPSGALVSILGKHGDYWLDMGRYPISGTSKTFKIDQRFLDFYYSELPNTDKGLLNFDIVDKNGDSLTPPEWEDDFKIIQKTLYIKPQPPTFDNVPTWQDINSTSVNFSNNNQMIVHGLSKLKISNINATAYKGATLKTIVFRNTNYSYSNVHTNGITAELSYLENKNYTPYLYIDIIDSRNLRNRIKIVDVSKFKYMYMLPKIKELSVERDGISETTILKAKGYYSEGYQVGINGLNSSYNYKENAAGTSWISGITNLRIKKTMSREYEDFLAILNEYENPTYEIDENNLQYYNKQIFENGINDLFSNAISYNDKYTQEYLQTDYDSINERYYCKSGGYNGSWKQFWEDTLELIYNQIYENGGNYEFEIVDSLDNPDVAIQGDIQSGFSIDKVFNIQLLIADMMNQVNQMALLPTAIPAIDVYKSNVAIHGLYNEILGGTQLNGDLYVDGVKVSLNKSSITCNCKTNTNNTSTSSFTQIPLTEIINNGTKLTFDTTNNRIYAEEDCTVIASAQLYITAGVTSASTGVSVCIRKNGSQYKRALCPTPNNYRMTQVNGALINLLQGDYIDLAFLSGDKTGITCSSGADSYITVYEI